MDDPHYDPHYEIDMARGISERDDEINRLREENRKLREAIVARLRLAEGILAEGKGTWPDSSYKTDECWARWQGQSYSLRSVLQVAGIDPDEALKDEALKEVE